MRQGSNNLLLVLLLLRNKLLQYNNQQQNEQHYIPVGNNALAGDWCIVAILHNTFVFDEQKQDATRQGSNNLLPLLLLCNKLLQHNNQQQNEQHSVPVGNNAWAGDWCIVAILHNTFVFVVVVVLVCIVGLCVVFTLSQYAWYLP
jgi:hypothetical protein